MALLVAISPQTSNFFRRATPAELERLSPHGLRLDLYKKMFDMIGQMMLGGGSGGGASGAPRDRRIRLQPGTMGPSIGNSHYATMAATGMEGADERRRASTGAMSLAPGRLLPRSVPSSLVQGLPPLKPRSPQGWSALSAPITQTALE